MSSTLAPACCLLVLVTLHIALTDARPAQHGDEARIEAFKQSVLGRMGLSHEPNVPPRMNMTLEEKRSKLRLYRRSVQELRGQIHDLYEDEDTHLLAKQYHNIKASGENIS